MTEIEETIKQMEIQNQQLQSIALQKQALMIQDREVENALEELKKEGIKEVFKSVGPILIKIEKQNVSKELTETREEIELKLKTVEKQEKRIRDKLKESQENFQNLVPKHTGQGG